MLYFDSCVLVVVNWFVQSFEMLPKHKLQDRVKKNWKIFLPFFNFSDFDFFYCTLESLILDFLMNRMNNGYILKINRNRRFWDFS